MNADIDAAGTPAPSRWPTAVALVIGVLVAVLTINVDNPTFHIGEPLGMIIGVLVIPGLLVSMVLGGNVHTISLWLGGAANFIFYFGITWAIWKFIGKKKTLH